MKRTALRLAAVLLTGVVLTGFIVRAEITAPIPTDTRALLSEPEQETSDFTLVQAGRPLPIPRANWVIGADGQALQLGGTEQLALSLPAAPTVSQPEDPTTSISAPDDSVSGSPDDSVSGDPDASDPVIEESQTFTVSCWIRTAEEIQPQPDDTDVPGTVLALQEEEAAVSWLLCRQGSLLQLYREGEEEPASTANWDESDTWRRLTIAWDGTALRLYQNEQALIQTTIDTAFSPVRLLFGQCREDKQGLSLQLDDIRLYDRLLSEEEIAALSTLPEAAPEHPPAPQRRDNRLWFLAFPAAAIVLLAISQLWKRRR